MKRPIIIALVGNSGSGKTSLSLYLQERFGIPALVSYTTRPMREGEADGIDHHFVEDASSMPENPLAHTVFAGKHYWTSHSQISTPVVTYVIDEAGLVELKEKWSDRYNVLAFYIYRPDNPTSAERKNRDKDRLKLPASAYEEILDNTSSLPDFCNLATTSIIKAILKNIE